MKKKIEKYNKKEEEHSKKLSNLEARLELDKSFSTKDGNSQCEESKKCSSNLRGDLKINQMLSERTDDDNGEHVNTNQILSLLSKNLKLIKYYYLANSSYGVELKASSLSLNSKF